MSDAATVGTRSIDLEVELEAAPDVVWSALTDAQELQNWFPLEARVNPGEGGSIFISWGPGVEGEGQIDVWEPGRHLSVVERSGEDEEGRPVRVAVDYHIAPHGDGSILRIVHSGFSADANWDEYYDTTQSGWRYFLWHLQYYLARHRGTARQMAWTRVASQRTREDVWARLLGSEGLTLRDASGPVGSPAVGDRYALSLGTDHEDHGELVVCEPHVHFAVTFADLEDGVLLAELEPGEQGLAPGSLAERLRAAG